MVDTLGKQDAWGTRCVPHALAWCLVGFVALAGPAVPFPAPAAHAGRIYVYAPRETAARSWLGITCGGLVVAELRRGILFAIDVPPGRQTLSTEEGVPISVELRAGEEAFVRLDWNYEVGRPPIPVLSVVPSKQARRQMQYLSYISGKHVRSRLVSKTDPREPEPLEFKRRPEP